jgi:hypothetical protein
MTRYSLLHVRLNYSSREVREAAWICDLELPPTSY